jgi:amino acid transporter
MNGSCDAIFQCTASPRGLKAGAPTPSISSLLTNSDAARNGLVPQVFSDIYPNFRTPWRSNLLFMLFVAPHSAFLPLAVVGHMTSIGTLFAFVIV